MKKTSFIFVLLFSIAEFTVAQTKTTYSLFTYTSPKGTTADETDPMQKVYYKAYENNSYAIFYVWQKKTATATPASDYSAFIKQLQEMYPSLDSQYSREPTITTEKGKDIVWQKATAKANDINIKTQKEEPIDIIIKVLRNKKQTAAIHIVTNDADRAKGDIHLFLKTLKYKQ